MDVYRTAPERGPALALLCPTCGASQTIHDSTYQCKKCRQEHAVLPDKAPEVSNFVVVHGRSLADVEKARTSGPQIQPLAVSLGVIGEDGGADDVLVVECDGVEIRVWVETNSGSPVALVFTAEVESSFEATFQRETGTHRDAKQDGLTVEVQTGDPAFDEEVFVDTGARSEDVLSFLSGRAVRAALRRLLAEASSVEIGHHKTQVQLAEREPVDAARAKRILTALRTVVGGARPARSEKAPVPRALGWLTVAAPFGFVVGVTLVVVGAARYTPVTAAPVLAGGVLGLVAGQLPAPLLKRAVAGTSSSHLHYGVARGISTVQAILVGIGLLLTLNGALDRSPARSVVLRGVETRYDDEDHRTSVEIETQEPGLAGRHTFHFDDRNKSIRLPAAVHLTYRRGYFGYAWKVGQETLEMIKQ